MGLKLMDQRTPTWASFTTQFPEGTTAADAVERAHLSELVVKAPLYAEVDGLVERIEGKYAMLMPGKGTFMGIAGEKYDFLQNSELAALLDNTLVKKFPVIAAGDTPDGAGVVFVLDMGGFSVAGEDVHQYFVIAEARTVGVSLKWALTPTRLACLNTLMTAFHNATALVNARHDQNFKSNVGQGAKFVLEAEVQAARVALAFEAMARRPIRPDNFRELLEYTYPYPDRAKLDSLQLVLKDRSDDFSAKKLKDALYAHEYYTNRANQFRNLTWERFEGFETAVPELRGTYWAAYNSVVEVQDFGISTERNSPAVLSDALLGGRANVKVRALDYIASELG